MHAVLKGDCFLDLKNQTKCGPDEIHYFVILFTCWLFFPQIPLRVQTTTLLLDGFTMLPHSGCLLWSSYQSSPMGLCWLPLQNSRNSVTLSTGSWSILLLPILERQFLLALLAYAINFLVTLFLDIQCASLRATLSQFVVSSHK